MQYSVLAQYLRSGYHAAAVPFQMVGLGGPGAPHYFHFQRRGDAGRPTRCFLILIHLVRLVYDVPLSSAVGDISNMLTQWQFSVRLPKVTCNLIKEIHFLFRLVTGFFGEAVKWNMSDTNLHSSHLKIQKPPLGRLTAVLNFRFSSPSHRSPITREVCY